VKPGLLDNNDSIRTTLLYATPTQKDAGEKWRNEDATIQDRDMDFNTQITEGTYLPTHEAYDVATLLDRNQHYLTWDTDEITYLFIPLSD